jgi:hypothetical protein
VSWLTPNEITGNPEEDREHTQSEHAGTNIAQRREDADWANPVPHAVSWSPLVGNPAVQRTWALWPAISRHRDVGYLVTAFEEPQPMTRYDRAAMPSSATDKNQPLQRIGDMTIYRLTNRLHHECSVYVPENRIGATVAAWLADLGADSPLVEDLALAVRSGDWPAAHSLADYLSVQVTVAA